MSQTTKKWIGWILSGLLALVLLASGIFKLTGGNPEMVALLGGTGNLTAIGLMEVAIVAIFLFPRTALIGLVLMVAYMGGAMAVHLVNGQSIVVQTTIQILIWITAQIRFSLFKSLGTTSPA